MPERGLSRRSRPAIGRAGSGEGDPVCGEVARDAGPLPPARIAVAPAAAAHGHDRLAGSEGDATASRHLDQRPVAPALVVSRRAAALATIDAQRRVFGAVAGEPCLYGGADRAVFADPA